MPAYFSFDLGLLNGQELLVLSDATCISILFLPDFMSLKTSLEMLFLLMVMDSESHRKIPYFLVFCQTTNGQYPGCRHLQGAIDSIRHSLSGHSIDL